jgi:dinuclear metal center YbgI/SA1388 family protein
MQRSELVTFLDSYLNLAAIRDYGPQGLQVEGRSEVNHVVAMVDAQLPCVEAAVAAGADLLLVHHGIFWGPTQRLAGSFGALVRRYWESGLNLYAAHLALDAHPEVGNNAVLAQRLGLAVESWFASINGTNLAALAVTPAEETPLRFDELVARFAAKVGAPRLVQAEGPAMVRRVGILSGSGIREIGQAAALGCDTFITGETSHADYYAAGASGLNVIYGGHYATETVGVQALGRLLADRFGITCTFIDLPTGL